jgi:hypothetical protein
VAAVAVAVAAPQAAQAVQAVADSGFFWILLPLVVALERLVLLEPLRAR